MAIRRGKQESNYTVIPNAVFNDPNLRWRDLGLLVYLISKPANWNVSVTQLANARDAARDAIRKSIGHLVDAGYIIAEEQRGDGGKYIGIDYIVFDTPQTPNPQPETEKPGPCNPGPNNAPPTKYCIKQSTDKNKTLGASARADGTDGDDSKPKNSRNAYPDEFELLWSEYPRRFGSQNKSQAFKAWKARKREGEDHQTLMDGIMRYRRYLKASGKDGTEFVMQAATFFGPDRRYADEYPDAPPVKSGGSADTPWDGAR